MEVYKAEDLNSTNQNKFEIHMRTLSWLVVGQLLKVTLRRNKPPKYVLETNEDNEDNDELSQVNSTLQWKVTLESDGVSEADSEGDDDEDGDNGEDGLL